MLMRKSSERSRSNLKPRFPRLELLRRRREIDAQFVDTVSAIYGLVPMECQREKEAAIH